MFNQCKDLEIPSYSHLVTRVLLNLQTSTDGDVRFLGYTGPGSYSQPPKQFKVEPSVPNIPVSGQPSR